MAITFSIPDTEIFMTTGQAEVLCQDLVNACREFEDEFSMMGNDHIVDAEGKANLGGGTATEIVLTLRNPWTIQFEDEGSEHVSVRGGSLIALDGVGAARPVSTNPSLTINQAASGTLISGGGGEPDWDTLLDLVDGVESGLTLREALRVVVAANAGKLSGADTLNVKIRDTNDTKDRIDAVVDEDGNRTSVTLDTSD